MATGPNVTAYHCTEHGSVNETVLFVVSRHVRLSSDRLIGPTSQLQLVDTVRKHAALLQKVHKYLSANNENPSLA